MARFEQIVQNDPRKNRKNTMSKGFGMHFAFG
jgi:hypothetical protein